MAVARALECECWEREPDAADLHDLSRRVALVIAAGRESIGPARALARLPSGPAVVVMQPVVWRPADFDLIWAPAHDRLPLSFGRRGAMMHTLTAPTVVDGAAMRAARRRAAPLFEGFARPLVGVLVGGPGAYRFGAAEADELAARLHALAIAHGVGLALTTSRRTPQAVAERLRDRLSGLPDTLIFNVREPGATDPATLYAAILDRAAAFVVTADSVAMLSEAAATGKPIHGWRLPGGRAKFERFHTGLIAHGAMRWFDGRLSPWSYPPLDAAAVIAQRIAELMGLLEGTGHRM